VKARQNGLKWDPFADLTWNGLLDWTGSEVASRERTYQRKGSVQELVLGWMTGVDVYLQSSSTRNRQRLSVLRKEFSAGDNAQASEALQ
jgi:hypothetical protein